MKCVVCGQELPTGAGKCPKCRFPVYHVIAENEESRSSIEKLAEDYRKNLLKKTALSITAVEYLYTDGELKFQKEEELPLADCGSLEKDVICWMDADFGREDGRKEVEVSLVVRRDSGEEQRTTLSMAAPKLEDIWHVGAVLRDGCNVRIAVGNAAVHSISEDICLLDM